MDTTTRTFQIPSQHMGRFEKRAGQLARRAVKLGCAPIVWERTGTAEQRLVEHGAARIVEIAVVEVTGPAPRLPGWTFAATIQHLDAEGEGGACLNLLRVMEGAGEFPARFRDCPPACDHCRKNRRRNDTYIVRSDAGEYKQIGRNCVADFCGHPSAQDIAAASEWIPDLEDEVGSYGEEEGEGYGARGPSAWELRVYLGHCYDLMAIEGYVSRKAAEFTFGKQATSALAAQLLVPPKGKTYVPPTAGALSKADEAIEWARDWNNLSDFAHNCRTIARIGRVEWRTFGMAAAIAVAYEREMGRIAEARVAEVESKHFGAVGKRERFSLSVLRAHSYDSAYGTKTVVTFRDDAGNRAIWFASGVPDLRAGHRYTVKATVKRHGYEGVREGVVPNDKPHPAQTELQRVMVEVDHGNPRAIPLPEAEVVQQ